MDDENSLNKDDQGNNNSALEKAINYTRGFIKSALIYMGSLNSKNCIMSQQLLKILTEMYDISTRKYMNNHIYVE